MSAKQGMDVVAIRAMARDFGRASERLMSAASAVDGALTEVWWEGRDADAFRSSWSSRDRSTLEDAATRLGEMRTTLDRQAREQETASRADGAPTSTKASFLPREIVETVREFTRRAPTTDDVEQGLRRLGGATLRVLDWLAGPKGPAFEDATRLVPGLRTMIGVGIDVAMVHRPVAFAIEKVFGFEKVREGDYYTTTEHSMQSHFGFHTAYDKVHKLFGMDLKDRVMPFEVDGVEYKLELWKGGYGSSGAFGGEIGLYTRRPGETFPRGLLEKIPGYYSSARGDDQIAMTQTVYDKHTGEPYFTNPGRGSDDGEHYWNLAIRTAPGVRHEDLGQRGTLRVEDPEVRNAMLAAMQGKPGLTAHYDESDGLIHYDWYE